MDKSRYHIDTPLEKEMKLLAEELRQENVKLLEEHNAEIKERTKEYCLKIIEYFRKDREERRKRRTNT